MLDENLIACALTLKQIEKMRSLSDCMKEVMEAVQMIPKTKEEK